MELDRPCIPSKNLLMIKTRHALAVESTRKKESWMPKDYMEELKDAGMSRTEAMQEHKTE
jgi:uncharacterized protein YjiS (DUF1127 family)